eukprot:3118625-Amphidinium_carterae.1
MATIALRPAGVMATALQSTMQLCLFSSGVGSSIRCLGVKRVHMLWTASLVSPRREKRMGCTSCHVRHAEIANPSLCIRF